MNDFKKKILEKLLEEKASEEAKYTEKMKERYTSCDHIWVKTQTKVDGCEGRSYNYYGCVKCSLDERLLAIDNGFVGPWASLDDKIMIEFMNHSHYRYGIFTNIYCGLKQAQDIYTKIKKQNPDIDDHTASKYLESEFAKLIETKNKNNKIKIKRND